MTKRFFTMLVLCAALLSPFIVSAGNFWQLVSPDKAPQNLQGIHPASFLAYTLDEATLKLQLWSLSNDPNEGMVMTLPMPDGSFMDFNVWQTPVMPGELAAKYPDIKTFTAVSLVNRNITAKLDFTLYGFHAMIYNGEGTSFVDPYDNYNDGFYIAYYKKDAQASSMKCGVTANNHITTNNNIVPTGSLGQAFKTTNGYQLRTYRLALCADNFYCAASPVTTTIAAALSKMTTTMNRVNGVYEREISVTLVFVAKEDTLIWTTATGGVNGADPFASINSDAGACLPENQTVCDARIGDANYDMGHVFTTGAGGLSDVGVTCQSGFKANSVTGLNTPFGDGFDIDYVAHEMGHELGGDHPFNNGLDGSCGGGNRNQPTAYEPGSGSTIMAYAGICAPDDLQPHSDAYFNSINLLQIQQYITTLGDVCAVKTATGNKSVNFSPYSATYNIPYQTPFELNAPFIADSVADTSVLYCWEQWDVGDTDAGDVGLELINTHDVGPLFRSYSPVATNLRVFPKESLVVAGILSNAGTEDNEGEKAPDVSRTMHFKCTFRDIINNLGCITIPDDLVTIYAINTGTGFTVTSQSATGITYTGHSPETVIWTGGNTGSTPISTTNVDIYMSVDGGMTWPYYVGNFPNSGSAGIIVPNPAVSTSAARFKVKGSGNIFFNVNSKNFRVNYNSGFPISPVTGVQQTPLVTNDVKIFPVPANNILHIATSLPMQAVVYNSIGQLVWNGQVSKQSDISVASWPRGIYYVQLTDENSQRIVKKFVVE